MYNNINIQMCKKHKQNFKQYKNGNRIQNDDSLGRKVSPNEFQRYCIGRYESPDFPKYPTKELFPESPFLWTTRNGKNDDDY